MTATSAVVRLERTIPAPPERVYRAWLEPDLLQRWMSPRSVVTTRAEVDERSGGRYRIWHAIDGEDRGGFEAEVVELVPHERIVLRWGFVGPARDPEPELDSRLTVEMRPADGGATELTLVHERLEAFAAAYPEIAVNVEGGWAQALDKLAGALA